jgi:hypothetical protein
VSGPDPTQRGPEPILGYGLCSWRSWTLPRRSVCIYRGPAPSHGSRLTVDTLEYIIFSGHVAVLEPSTWWGRALFTTRLEIATWVSRLHTVVRGTPISGYRQWSPGPPQGRIRACRWGPKLNWRLVRRFRAFADVITANPPSVTPTAMSIPTTD